MSTGTIVTDLMKALDGVIKIADRETVEFQFARTVLARARAVLDLDRAETMYHHDHWDTSYLLYRERQQQSQIASLIIPLRCSE